jgi:hypothetical protein
MPSVRASSDGTLSRLYAVVAAALLGCRFVYVPPGGTPACPAGLNAGWLPSAPLELDAESSSDPLADGPWFPYIASVAPPAGSRWVASVSCGVSGPPGFSPLGLDRCAADISSEASRGGFPPWRAEESARLGFDIEAVPALCIMAAVSWVPAKEELPVPSNFELAAEGAGPDDGARPEPPSSRLIDMFAEDWATIS